MNAAPVQCPNCRAPLLESMFNQPGLGACPACSTMLQVDVFPAFYRPVAPGQSGETIMIEGEASCFFHPQKKAVLACEGCGRFLCALCDCEVKGRHLCPTCLESGQKKQTIQGLEDERPLYRRMALMLSFIPPFGPVALYVALRYRKTPGSLVQPMNWAMPTALVLATLQTLAMAAVIAYAIWK